MRHTLGQHVIAAVLLALAACGRHTPEMVVDRVHDLVSLLPSAQFGPRSPYRVWPVAAVEADDHRDGMAYLRATHRGAITFQHLQTWGQATLTFGCGVALQAEGVGSDDAVRFVVEVRREVAGADETLPMTVMFDQVLRPRDFDANTRFRSFSVQLPGQEPAQWTLQLRCVPVQGTSRKILWPGFTTPTLRSEGRRMPLAQRPVRPRTVHLDLIDQLEAAEIALQREDDPVRVGFFDAAEDTVVAGGRRALLRASAPARVVYRLSPPAGSRLECAVGMDTASGWRLRGDGMTFAVEINGQRVWSLHVDPHHRKNERGWKPVSIDLDPWADRSVTLALITETGESGAHDVGGFSHPRILTRHSVRRLAADEAPTVLLIVVDTLRADRIGSFGGPDQLTPNIDAWAERGVRFPGARSVSSWTWPATGSILTGLYPNSHGVQDSHRCYLVDRIESLAELFAQRGYTTGAFVANLLISTDNNFQQGFETFVTTPYATARALNQRLAAWLDNTEGTARFAYLHYFDPHAPYRPPDPFLGNSGNEEPAWQADDLLQRIREDYEAGALDSELVERWMGTQRRRYDAEVAYLDTAFGELMDELERRGVLRDCLIVFTSDHGEEFFDHGLVSHGPHLYEESVRVPLWITGTGRAALSPRLSPGAVETRGILPTLCAQVGLDLPASLAAAPSLLEEDGHRTGPSVFAQTWHGHEPGVEGWTEKRALTRGRWKLIYTPATRRAELYDLEDDAAEQRDLADMRPDLRDRLLDELRRWNDTTLAGAPDSRRLDPAEMEARLRELGYVGR